MEVIYKSVEHNTHLGSIKSGECFIFENDIYVRTTGNINNSIQVVRLDDGTLRTMVRTKKVTPVKCTVNFEYSNN